MIFLLGGVRAWHRNSDCATPYQKLWHQIFFSCRDSSISYQNRAVNYHYCPSNAKYGCWHAKEPEIVTAVEVRAIEAGIAPVDMMPALKAVGNAVLNTAAALP